MSISNRNKMPAATMVAVILVAAGCANAEDQQEPKLTLESVPSVVTVATSVPPAPIGAGMQRLVDMATRNLATKLGIEEADITVAQAEYVTWRDSSIGCPQPDMQYMQVLTNGSRIVLKANNSVYHYHSGGNRPPSYCAKPAPQRPLPYAPGET